MESEEPAASLIDAFSDEVGRIHLAVVEQLFVLKRIVYLGVRHGTGVEPNVDEVEFAVHWLSVGRHQYDIIDIRTVQIDFLVVFFGVVAGHKAFVAQRVRFHHTGLYGTVYLVIQCFYRVDANFLLAVVSAPDWQRGTPVARTREIPVLQVFEPLAESARAG